MEKLLKKHLGKGANPTPDRYDSRGSKTATNPNKTGCKGGGNLCAMKGGETGSRSTPTLPL